MAYQYQALLAGRQSAVHDLLRFAEDAQVGRNHIDHAAGRWHGELNELEVGPSAEPKIRHEEIWRYRSEPALR